VNIERWVIRSVRWSISGNLFPKYNPRIKDIIKNGNNFIYCKTLYTNPDMTDDDDNLLGIRVVTD